MKTIELPTIPATIVNKVAFPMAIALVTTVSTITVLNALMPSVWCTKANSDSSYDVLYGEHNCHIRLNR